MSTRLLEDLARQIHNLIRLPAVRHYFCCQTQDFIAEKIQHPDRRWPLAVFEDIGPAEEDDSRQVTLSEKYAVLTVIHDHFYKNDGPIMPFADPLSDTDALSREGRIWAFLRDHVRGHTLDDGRQVQGFATRYFHRVQDWHMDVVSDLQGRDLVNAPSSTTPPSLTESAQPSEGEKQSEKAKEMNSKKAKRSTQKGEAREKLIAALTKHHKYADGGCLNPEPIGNNELARMAEVDRSTASAFFKKEFKGYDRYKAMCRSISGLVAALKLLNNEFPPHLLYGKAPPSEAERTD